MVRELAQNIQLPDGTTIVGPLDPARFPNLASVVTNALTYLFPITGFILLGYLLWGGFDYLTSLGDPKKAELGKQKITNALIGVVIIFVSFWLVQVIDYIFELNIY